MTPHEKNRQRTCCLCLLGKSRSELSKAGTLNLLTCKGSPITIRLAQLLVSHSVRNPFHPTVLCSLCYQLISRLVNGGSLTQELSTMVASANEKFRRVPRYSSRVPLPPICNHPSCFLCTTAFGIQSQPNKVSQQSLGRPKKSPTAPSSSTPEEKILESPLSIKDMCFIQSETGVSDRTLLKIAKCLRIKMGRNFIEAGLAEGLQERNMLLAHHYKEVVCVHAS